MSSSLLVMDPLPDQEERCRILAQAKEVLAQALQVAALCERTERRLDRTFPVPPLRGSSRIPRANRLEAR